jgi:formylmethanofuran dehydrogenase subunit A
MVARGRVQNGVIVLEDGIHLPEGQEVKVLSSDGKVSLRRGQGSHSYIDIPSVSVGTVLQPLTPDDDILGEMLEGRV